MKLLGKDQRQSYGCGQGERNRLRNPGDRLRNQPASQLIYVRRMRCRRLIWICAVMLALTVAYVGVFWSWWSQSPTRVYVERGREVRDVDIHYNRFFWKTDVIWIPAFWWMEYIRGYKYISVAAMEEQTIVTYSR